MNQNLNSQRVLDILQTPFKVLNDEKFKEEDEKLEELLD